MSVRTLRVQDAVGLTAIERIMQPSERVCMYENGQLYVEWVDYWIEEAGL